MANTSTAANTAKQTPQDAQPETGRVLSMLGTGLFWQAWLLVAIVMSGIAVVLQVHSYRKSFTESQQLRVERKQLDTEWHRLLIEQQTFGATTQIGGRAVVSMGMYSPKHSDVITLMVKPLTEQATVAGDAQ